VSIYLSQFEDKTQYGNLASESGLENSNELAEIDYVVDGDTLKLKNGEKVRLLGINAPENGTCYFNEATNYLKILVNNSNIRLESDTLNSDRDKYGRLLRYVYVGDLDVNEKMVKDGYAEYYENYDVLKSNEYLSSEDYAKKNSLGLWKNCLNSV